MTGMLERQRLPVRRRWVRWLLSAGLSLVVAGGAWRVVRPWLTVSLARSSVGCLGREELILAALRTLYPDRTSPQCGMVSSERRWGSSVVRWDTPRGTWAFADGDLEFLGEARLDYAWTTSSADADHAGCLEVVSEWPVTPPSDNPNAAIARWVVLRLHAAHNEVLGIVTADLTPGRAAGRSAVVSTWRDEDGDGLEELVFLSFVRGRLPSGTMGLLPPNVVAVFGWSAPGGALRPRQMPTDGTFVAWAPPDGQPVRTFPQEQLQPLLDTLVPLPEGFGLPVAPSPASAPSGPTSTRSSSP